ncbi:sugar kinase [Ideonella azotifigens]|uniref:Sugar kinase n=1 Tax=Ideonella azotifigens TaxID=513160 RepID=A0ABN1JY95_9BURK|nr:sugar kinase [Ideonella azotifigens]
MSASAALDVLTAGEALVLLAAEETGGLHAVERFRRFSAGAELNVAIGLARLGLRVGYLTRLGDDAFGRFLAEVLRREGIVADFASVDQGSSNGFMLKSLEADGTDPQIEYFRRGSAASRMHAGDLARLDGTRARHLHLTGILPALSPGCSELAQRLAERAREQGSSLSFDPNLRPRLWPDREQMIRSINGFAAISDLVLPGLAEGRLLTGRAQPDDIADFYLALGAGAVVVKLGPDGAYCANQQGLRAHVPGVQVKRVVDTVGAGDGFAVGVVSALLEGLPLDAAAQRGCAIGARVVQFPGDCDGLPTRAQLQV